MEAIWKSILDVTSQVVIPDWGALVALLPVFLAILVIAWFAWTIKRFATAGPTRRAPARLSPVPPADVHMPGPSVAPIAAAFGAAALVWGLVVGPPGLYVGATVLVITLIYWGREAVRDYDHLERPETLPAVVPQGPPPGVHMPGPSFRPILGALGTAALMFGLVYGGWLLAAGILVLVVTLVGWLVDAKAEYVKTEEADRTGHLENIAPPAWPGRLLQAFAVVIVVAALLQFGVIPPRSSGGTGGGTATESAAPSGGSGGGSGSLQVVAKNIEFNTKSLSTAANAPFTIDFKNQDPPGVAHDIQIRKQDGRTVLQEQKTVDGGAETTYSYQPLPAGTYVFICSVHPIAGMTGTLTVK